ncbi:hypothetical protein FHX09_004248 [Rhizobium sp. BK538]|nr:hypothetical protein [Rhizobium sp. BK060]MBB4170370.1 hypothetical protein [Rhizobium sp. BK538]
MNVFDNRDLESGFVIDITHDDRNLDQASKLRRAPPSFAGYDLELATRQRADYNGLNDTMLPDRARKLVQFAVIEEPSRIARIATDELDGHHLIGTHSAIWGINRHRLIHLTD